MCIHGFRVVPDEGVTLKSTLDDSELRVVDDGALRSFFYRGVDGSELLTSQINLVQPDVPVPSDARELLASFLLSPVQSHVLVVGGMNIGLIKFLQNFAPAQFIDVTEKDPSVISTAETYFGVRSDDKLTIRKDEKLNYLQGRPQGTYDVIYLDQIASGSNDADLESDSDARDLRNISMLNTLRDRLNETGVMMAVLRGDRETTEREIDQVIKVFPHVFVWDGPQEGNIVLAAVKRRQVVNPLVFRERARKLDLNANAGFSFAGFIDSMVAGEYRVMGI